MAQVARPGAQQHLPPAVMQLPLHRHTPGCCERITQILKGMLEWIVSLFTSCCTSRRAPLSDRIAYIKPTPDVLRIIERATTYHVLGDDIQITAANSTLIDNPLFHLQKLAECITDDSKHLKVTFLSDVDGQKQAGIDAGGLARQYTTSLLDGIMRSPKFAFQDFDKLKLPASAATYKEDSLELPQLTQEEQANYEALGKLLKFCYNNNLTQQNSQKMLLIGQRFHPCMIEATCRRRDNINSDTEVLSPFIKAEQNANEKELKLEMLSLIQKNTQLTIDLKNKYISFLSLDNNPDDETVLKGIRNSLYSNYSRCIMPIRALNAGLFFDKKKVTGHGSQEILNLIQGTLDRKQIAAAITIDPMNRSSIPINAIATAENKAQWLREWIQDLNTPIEAIKDFLLHISGVPVLAVGDSIKLNFYNTHPGSLPIAHSCFMSLDLSYNSDNNTNKDTFISKLKQSIETGLTGGFTNS